VAPHYSVSAMIRVLFVIGTRPEAIKLAPVILHQKSRPDNFEVTVCATAQHRSLLDEVLSIFRITPDFDLNVMSPGQTLCDSSAKILGGLDKVLSHAKPDVVIVQGDTTTTLCGALAGFYHRVPVAHVEAGLRTWDMHQPLPEEMNRVLTTRLAAVHFAPTWSARENLLREGCEPASVTVTGNTGIDAMLHVRDRLHAGELAGAGLPIDRRKKLILLTSHRRENFGRPFENICAAAKKIARRPDVQIVLPVHPNPQVRLMAESRLRNCANVLLVDPLPYAAFVDLMRKAHIVVTDSGGIQEEAPSLGKPILLLREKTERMEGVLAGTVKLIGTSEQKIADEITGLLDSPQTYWDMARQHSPYGDGQASRRISDGLLVYCGMHREARTTLALEQLSEALANWTPGFAAASAS
jgi:UDP-N-acetylglucosamine 2-epimerase (non-hydrolysing)